MTAVRDPEGSAPAAADEKPTVYAWYVTILLTLVYVISMVDRKFPFILVESIKSDLQLSDTQVGLLTGLMFTLTYAIFGIPIARLSDRHSRKLIISASLIVWSLLTSVGGFAQNFAQLAASRMGVAIGESGASPAAHSMLADYFAPKYRARAIGFYFTGAYLGALIGLAAGGWINDLANWRVAMMILGIPGLVLGVIFLITVKEPARRKDPTHAATPAPSMKVSLGAIFSDKIIVTLLMAQVMFGMTFGSAQAFAPAYLIRTFQLSTTEIGWSYGLCLGLSGICGALLGGYLGDRFSDRKWKGLFAIFLSLAIGSSAIGLALLSEAYLAFLSFFFFSHVGMMVYAGPTFAFVQSRLNSRMHSMASAVNLFASSGLGTATGPLIAGMLSDHYKRGGAAEPLKMALFTMLIPGAVGSLLYLRAALQARRER